MCLQIVSLVSACCNPFLIPLLIAIAFHYPFSSSVFSLLLPLTYNYIYPHYCYSFICLVFCSVLTLSHPSGPLSLQLHHPSRPISYPHLGANSIGLSVSHTRLFSSSVPLSHSPYHYCSVPDNRFPERNLEPYSVVVEWLTRLLRIREVPG
jgi:hypothetical protein